MTLQSEHWYYLHTNGDLIHKRFAPESDSPFVWRVWRVDIADRTQAWGLLIEAAHLGASVARLKELGEKWNCDAKDFVEYVTRVPLDSITNDMRSGAWRYFDLVLNIDIDKWYDWLEKTPRGGTPNWPEMPGPREARRAAQ